MKTEARDFQLLPDLAPEEYGALKADIAARGVLVSIEIDSEGRVLDGHHRKRICDELGIRDYPTVVRIGFSDDDKLEHALKLNLARRHLSKDQLKEVAVKLRQRGWTQERIGGLLIVPQRTLSGWLCEFSETAELKSVAGKDGKSYPAARRPKSIVALNSRERKAALELAQDAGDALPDRPVTVRRAVKFARGLRPNGHGDASEVDSPECRLLLGDMRVRGAEIEDNSIDLILTDPPYLGEFLPLWSDLSRLAARVLKRETGLLVTWSAQMFLPEIIRRLEENLKYYWLGVDPHDHAQWLIYSRHVLVKFKPLLFFVREEFKPGPWRIFDMVLNSPREKGLHEWQQSLAPAKYYIEQLTPPGGLILDPFLGSGTSGVAAKELGRNFVGIENDPATFAVAKERILNPEKGHTSDEGRSEIVRHEAVVSQIL